MYLRLRPATLLKKRLWRTPLVAASDIIIDNIKHF